MYGGTGYGQPPAAGNANPEAEQWFRNVDTDNSGQIDFRELQAALVNGQGNNFSDNACKLMINMFDQDKSGTIGINEFQQLFNYINQWLSVFRNYDKDGSGTIDEGELLHALQQMGYRFTPEFVKFLTQKCDPKQHQCVTVDQFIVLCIQIQKFTEAFRTRDKETKGIITIGFEEFLGVAIGCSSL